MSDMHRFRTRIAVSSVVCAMIAALGVPLAASATAAPEDTGFGQPFLGPPRYAHLAPPKARFNAQINAPLGQREADRLARKLGYDKRYALSARQLRLMLSGRGKGGNTPKARASGAVIAESIRYLTNTTATQMYRSVDGERSRILLGSYGLIINHAGMLESPANDRSPVRNFNWLLVPEALCRTAKVQAQVTPGLECGYIPRFMRLNGAADSLRALYASTYPRFLPFGTKAQGGSEPDELLFNSKDGTLTTVGMSMAPAIWLVNFILVYSANPELGANMPAYWTPIPTEVVAALTTSDTGQVPFDEVRQYFPPEVARATYSLTD